MWSEKRGANFDACQTGLLEHRIDRFRREACAKGEKIFRKL